MSKSTAKRAPIPVADEPSKETRKRLDCFLEETIYRKLTILAATATPLMKPNRYATSILTDFVNAEYAKIRK